MNEKINQFLDSVCSNIKYKPVHKDIRDELSIHINELKDEFIEETQDENMALDKALLAMGDSNEIGRQLNKRHKPQTEWSLIGLTAFIAIIGGIVTYSSNYSYQVVNFERYLLFAVVGIAVMIGLYFFDYRKLKKLALPIYLLTFALLVVMLSFGGQNINGRKFFIIANLAISSEFANLFFLIAFAGFIDKASAKGFWGMIKLGILALASAMPIVMQPSLFQALSLLAGYAILIILAVAKNHFGGNRKLQIIFLGIMATLFGVFSSIFLNASYRTNRMMAFMTRGKSDPNGAGYHQILADKWLMSSEAFGTTNEKTVPVITMDYVFINVFTTLGWVAGITLILIIGIYIARMFIISRKIKNSYGFYLSFAACAALSIQFVTGILMNFGLFPNGSITIPFISYGGSGYISSMAFIGLILSVWRRNNIIANSNNFKNTSDTVADFIKFEDGKLILNFKSLKRL